MMCEWPTISQLDNALNSSEELQLPDDSGVMTITTIIRTIIIHNKNIHMDNLYMK